MTRGRSLFPRLLFFVVVFLVADVSAGVIITFGALAIAVAIVALFGVGGLLLGALRALLFGLRGLFVLAGAGGSLDLAGLGSGGLELGVGSALDSKGVALRHCCQDLFPLRVLALGERTNDVA